MKTILLPTDFSDNSLNAMHYAFQLFKNVECNFHILNIQKASSYITDDLMAGSSTSVYTTLVSNAKEAIAELITSLEKLYKNDKHSFNAAIDYDNFIDGINQMCETKKVDLIVMGTHGATGLERFLFGSNTVRVLQRCDTPVLVIPQDCSYEPLLKMAFISDYLDFDENHIQELKDMANLFASKVEVLHVIKEEDLSLVQLKNKHVIDKSLGNIDHTFINIEGETIYGAVSEYMEKHHVKLLAMMRRKHNFFERLFTKHNIEEFGFNIKRPLLVLC